MRFPAAYAMRSVLPTVLPILGATQTMAGAALDSGVASICAGAHVVASLTVNTMTVSGKWQVLDDDGSTWIDVVESNNPANVLFATGTGTLAVTKKLFSAPLAITAGNRSCRFIVQNAVASGGGGAADTVTIAYDYRMPVSAFGS